MGHPSPAVDGAKRKENEPCKFFPNCTNPECPYKQYSPTPHIHYPPNLATMLTCSPAVSVSKSLSIPCKFGVNCTRPNCIFNHELQIPCRYNPCLNENCLFKHSEGQQPNKNKVWTADANESSGGTLMDRKFAYDNADEEIMVGGGMEDDADDTVVHE
jgi:nuclear polyadenylated RNA-binding protein NAB2